MTKAEQVAFNQGIEACRQMAVAAAAGIEARGDASKLRHRAAAAALLGFAEGAKVLMVEHAPALVDDSSASPSEA